MGLNVAISYCRQKQKQQNLNSETAVRFCGVYGFSYCSGNTKLQLRVLCLTEIKTIVKKKFSLQQFLKREINLL